MVDDIKSLILIGSTITAIIGFALVDAGEVFYAGFLLISLVFNFLAMIVADRLK